jgi:hypothetical protein
MQRATPTSTHSPIGSPRSRRGFAAGWRSNQALTKNARSGCATCPSTSRVRAPMRSAGQPARAKAAASSAARCGSLSRIRIFGPSAAEAPRTTTAPVRLGCPFGRVLGASRPALSWHREPPNRASCAAREPGAGAPCRHTRSSRTSQDPEPRAGSRDHRTRSRKRDTWPRFHRPRRGVPRRDSFGQSDLAGSPMTRGPNLAGL